MTCGVLTVTTTAQLVPVTNPVRNGLRLLCRSANAGDVYVGTDNTVTNLTGNLLPKGDPGTTTVYTVPAEHFNSSRLIYVYATQSGQLVDWSED